MIDSDKVINGRYELVRKTIAKITSKFKLQQAKFEAELEDIENKYLILTGHLFGLANKGECSKKFVNGEFKRLVSSESIIAVADNLFKRVIKFLDSINVGKVKKTKKTIDRELARIIELYECFGTENLKTLNQPIANSKCEDCNIDLMTDFENSELICPNCSQIDKFSGSIFEEQYIADNTQNNKFTKTSSPDRHVKVCLDHILANEPLEEIGNKDDLENLHGEKLVKQLKDLIRKENKILLLTTVYDFRDMLKTIKRTKFNKNIPLLMKLVTGKGPPPISESIYQLVLKLFSVAIEIQSSIKQKKYRDFNEDYSDKYSSYYSHHIYKILEAKIPEAHPSRRILYYIYLQAQDTLNKHDHDWFEVCEQLKIKPISTNKSYALRYRPI